jgi:hypothetical protein
MRRRNIERVTPAAIYAVVTDGSVLHAFTEAHLDAWWASLPPEEKAEVYELHLGDGEERCRFCSCTADRACVTDGVPCCWLDVNHTVCSAQACAIRHFKEQFDQVFHGGPQTVVTRQEVEYAAV